MACNGTSPFLWRGKDEGSGRVDMLTSGEANASLWIWII